MERRIGCALWGFLVFVGLIGSGIAAEQQQPQPQQPMPSFAQIAGKPADVVYPFMAEATANDVYIRSGRGQGYYHCGKLNQGDKVVVVEEISGWAKILPLPEHYSWIHKNYVKIDPKNPRIGTVTGDGVRVWAGSDFIEPIRSSSLQTRLNSGEIVELLEPEAAATGDYYKIKPPTGAYLYVSCEYLRYTGPYQPSAPTPKEGQPAQPLTIEQRLGVADGQADEQPAPALAEPAAQEQQPAAAAQPAEPAKPQEPEKKEPPKPSRETQLLAECRALADKIDAERKKDLTQQNYAEYKSALKAIVDDPEAGRAATYATMLLEQVKRYELAVNVSELLRAQDERLEKVRQQIETARRQQVQKAEQIERKPLYTGTLRPSYVYTAAGGQRRYVLMDSAGKILCYITPANELVAKELQAALHQTVSIHGRIVPDPKAIIKQVEATEVIQDNK